MAAIDYDWARVVIEELFETAENDFREQRNPPTLGDVSAAVATIFNSSTQAYREVLLGCALARLSDRTINIRSPYMKQGPTAYNGRTLDERVVNPFLQRKQIPSSRGAFLAVFRRNVMFTETTAEGLRDQTGYQAFLLSIRYLESVSADDDVRAFIRHLLFKFVELRENSKVDVSRLQRISVAQYDDLIGRLLNVPSGGQLPTILVVATFFAIRDFFDTRWDINWQGINVADAASRAAGDVTIKKDGAVIFAAEVTERPIDHAKVVSTFQAKISPLGIENYLFFLKKPVASAEIREQAAKYFAQGHEIDFVVIHTWMLMVLTTIGKSGREAFNRHLVDLLSTAEVPAHVKMAWNDQLMRVIE